jgi:hypothetical protein
MLIQLAQQKSNSLSVVGGIISTQNNWVFVREMDENELISIMKYNIAG